MPRIVNGEIVSSPSSRRQPNGTSTGGGSTVGFSYDSSGRRIENDADTSATSNVLDRNNVLSALRSQPALISIVVLFVLVLLIGPQLCSKTYQHNDFLSLYSRCEWVSVLGLVLYGLLRVFSYVPPKPGSQAGNIDDNATSSSQARRTGLYTLADTNV